MYCTPDSAQKMANIDLLSYEEILRVVTLAVNLGIKKVRLTGGEPLVRKGVMDFIRQLAALPGLTEIRLTTNGVLLPDMVNDLYDVGIRKLNISLDSLQPEKFNRITGRDKFDKVWQGIEQAQKIGFEAIKINAVAMRGINDDEILDFARLTIANPFQIRFIEFMPIGAAAARQREKFISSAEIIQRISKLGELKPVESAKLHGPARILKLSGSQGTLGFISPLSNHFCDTCNRLRLTSEGKLRACLLTDKEANLKQILRSGGSDAEISKLIIDTVKNKPKGHLLSQSQTEGSCHGSMSRIGG
jgi:cyclic pyranopterin phosphate synthase